jgi:two-component system chemotaxis sensor kinase CheA
VGEHQTVIKTLGRVYKGVDGISGATILGDGTVALIMDIAKIIKCVVDEEVQNEK